MVFCYYFAPCKALSSETLIIITTAKQYLSDPYYKPSGSFTAMVFKCFILNALIQDQVGVLHFLTSASFH